MSYEKELLEVAIYQCGKLTPNEEDRLYKWIESLILAKRKADEYEAKAEAFDRVREKVYARINHIVRTSHPDQRKPGYIDGLYNALDIISEELESGESK